jgi:ribonuclease HI/endonuclease/exonuclease/phosphatase family metal-dependent hydrolase
LLLNIPETINLNQKFSTTKNKFVEDCTDDDGFYSDEEIDNLSKTPANNNNNPSFSNQNQTDDSTTTATESCSSDSDPDYTPDNENNQNRRSNGPRRPPSRFNNRFTARQIDEFSIIQWNLNGYATHFGDLKMLLNEKQPAIVCLQETHLKMGQKAQIGGYQSFTKSTESERAKHGVAILIKENIYAENLELLTQLQAVAVRISCHRDITICSLYLPPSQQVSESDLIDLINQLPTPFIVTGDLNARSPIWGSERTCRNGKIIENLLEHHNLSTINTGEATHVTPSSGSTSAIDVTIVSSELLPELIWHVHQDLCGSDHFPTITTILGIHHDDTKRPKWKLDSANWDKFKETVEDKLFELDHPPDAIEISKIIIEAATLNIKKSSSRIGKKCVPWWTPEIGKLIKDRRRAERRHRRQPTQENLIAYKRCRAKARYVMKRARILSWQKYVSSINEKTSSQEMWSKIRKVSGKAKRQQITSLKTAVGNITNKTDIAEELAAHFGKMTSSENHPNVFKENRARIEIEPIIPIENDDEDFNLLFTEDELENALSSCKGSSPGPDGVHYQMIKELPRTAKLALLHAYNKMWTEKTFPETWTESLAVPILKPGKDPRFSSSYRPISLTNCLCKLLEKIINNRLVHILECNKLLPEQQYGFRKNRSTEDVLLILEAEILEGFRLKQHILMTSLDISQAYDSCWRRLILEWLKENNIGGRMFHFISNFISNRTFKVIIGNTESTRMSSEDGVVQGAVLSVTLFLLALSKIALGVGESVKIVGYADDWCLITRNSKLEIAQSDLQIALNNIVDWSEQTGFSISREKTKAMYFQKRRTLGQREPRIFMQNHEIEFVESHKVLGLHLDSHLNWQKHLNETKAKAAKKMNIIKYLANTNWGSNQDTLLKIHNMIILSTIEYGSSIYSSASAPQLRRLDPIHNKGLQLSIGSFCICKTENLLCEAGAETLEQRRKINIVRTVLKIRSNADHPLNRCLENSQLYEDYATNNQRKPFAIRAQDICATFGVDLKDIRERISITYTPWRENIQKQIDYSLQAYSTNTNNNKKIAEFYHLMEKEYFLHQKIFTDGSLMDGRTSYAIVLPDRIIQTRMSDQTSIFHAEMQAITKAIKETNNVRRVILTDSLSSLTALERLYPAKNPAISDLRNLLHAEKDNLSLVWVPSHCGISGNEEADRAAKNALTDDVDHETKTNAIDWLKWIKHQQKTRRHQEWISGNNPMNIIKPNVRRYACNSSLPRRSQVVLSRLRMGYTRLTESYRMQREMPPFCERCNRNVTVTHILWDCDEFGEARRKHGISVNCLDDNLDQAKKTISYLKEIDLFYEI